MIEDEIIERIGRRMARRRSGAKHDLILGIGDDAAILRPRAGSDLVLSTDFSIEGVHFLDFYPPEAIGYRALARAASDLAAMGARPQFFLLSISLPDRRADGWLDRMLRGMNMVSRRYGLQLIGGDTTRWPKVVISITVIGRTGHGLAIRRDRARVGGRIYVSGRLGAAALGLAVLLKGRRNKQLARGPRYQRLLRPHLYPSIPMELGIHLAERKLASAMIDLSDGLSSDLGRLARASRVGARIYADRLPAVSVPEPLARSGLRQMDLALNGGEDYGLLFTVPIEISARIPARFRGIPITCIGEITRQRRVQIVESDGRPRQLPAAGWDPFRQER